MQVLQSSRHIRLSLGAIPPMHTWPSPLKKVVLAAAIVSVFGAYLLLGSGLLGGALLLLKLATE